MPIIFILFARTLWRLASGVQKRAFDVAGALFGLLDFWGADDAHPTGDQNKDCAGETGFLHTGGGDYGRRAFSIIKFRTMERRSEVRGRHLRARAIPLHRGWAGASFRRV